MADNSAGKVLLVDDSAQVRAVIRIPLKDVFPVFVEADDG